MKFLTGWFKTQLCVLCTNIVLTWGFTFYYPVKLGRFIPTYLWIYRIHWEWKILKLFFWICRGTTLIFSTSIKNELFLIVEYNLWFLFLSLGAGFKFQTGWLKTQLCVFFVQNNFTKGFTFYRSVKLGSFIYPHIYEYSTLNLQRHNLDI